MDRPHLTVHPVSELPVSGEVLTELLQTVLDHHKSFRFQARGWSMAPFIKDRDVICLSPLGGRLPRLGQVVAFIHPRTGKLVVHRIIAMRGPVCNIKGDNIVGEADGWVRASDILAYVTRVDRKNRRVLLGLGPERILIAWLSRLGLLLPILGRMRQIIKGKMSRH